MTRYALRFTEEAQEDLLRLFDFLLQFDLDVALRARQAIEDSLQLLEQFPFTCRKAANGAHGPRLRELVISFGATGYVALFEIDDATTVTVLAIRHQREEDFH
ncbi:type II toxin-antitoxin system RelE/ParE family toxin [Limnohabitans sp.]|jgi:plasmid stabilization system protein ParE|uniref:type II toxin-antitoxin system RelE/ParE family toxin n=1 Tax=Limnohabitans sp. TaxID=1907725 RepID=UPI0038B88F51